MLQAITMTRSGPPASFVQQPGSCYLFYSSSFGLPKEATCTSDYNLSGQELLSAHLSGSQRAACSPGIISGEPEVQASELAGFFV
jgi:hypothetical protein